MGHTTRNATQDMTTTEGGSRDALEAQLLELQAEIKALREARYPDRPPPSESKPRVPTFLPKFKGRRGEDGSSKSTHCVASTAMTPRTPT
ncbi:hypothetical protein PC129_g2567 [Phytophthora cactorum]|uniref:Uncharacterized protein n=1 Tax=Phytophthora cactorum TaxID=29920 RepID=A0A8T1LCJ7_9STRA|nr:hypothetical protein Pcac1_g11358 [Phytophthora cactorum]KAG2839257.1 hypothetical protein PC112_g4204 [Phytophthora cactorum]KAG2841349.1 hypothetical protein PC111_g3147 [Phytophthora cactorum]KAG2865008.1 hypothetical protein PC113_g4100 [Phytophthora cactorum]KAG2924291.1 hypothetical protein PC114_g4575 [Phytophthora cactorum]